MSRKYVARLLERQGYQVECASSGLDALELMKKNFYDCVFLDLEMPGMNGFDCAEAYRGWESKIQRPWRQLICATSSHTSEKETRALSTGIDHFQCKPARTFDLSQIADVSRQRLQRDIEAGSQI